MVLLFITFLMSTVAATQVELLYCYCQLMTVFCPSGFALFGVVNRQVRFEILLKNLG
jgi:hypothetical protein